DVCPSETRLSKSSNRSATENKSVINMVAGPENAQGGLLVSSATGFVVATHTPAHEKTAELVVPENRNSWKLPSGVIAVAKAANCATPRNTIPYSIALPRIRNDIQPSVSINDDTTLQCMLLA